MTGDKKFALFSYGTLREPEVQRAVFGRTVPGDADRLHGFAKVPILIAGEPYVTLRPSPGAVVEGMVLQVTEAELSAADIYEGSADYRRVKVSLASGRDVFVYRSAN